VLVADYDKHRVLLLNSRLELERVLLDTEHHQLVQSPWQLCYVVQNRQLVVSSKPDWLNHVFQVFKI
jgi:hypothetical protein